MVGGSNKHYVLLLQAKCLFKTCITIGKNDVNCSYHTTEMYTVDPR